MCCDSESHISKIIIQLCYFCPCLYTWFITTATRHEKKEQLRTQFTHVGRTFSRVLFLLVRISLQASFTLVTLLALSWRTTLNRSRSLKMKTSLCSWSRGNASVSSGNDFHASQADFVALPKNQEVVSHPVNEWNIGSGLDVSRPRNARCHSHWWIGNIAHAQTILTGCILCSARVEHVKLFLCRRPRVTSLYIGRTSAWDYRFVWGDVGKLEVWNSSCQ